MILNMSWKKSYVFCWEEKKSLAGKKKHTPPPQVLNGPPLTSIFLFQGDGIYTIIIGLYEYIIHTFVRTTSIATSCWPNKHIRVNARIHAYVNSHMKIT